MLSIGTVSPPPVFLRLVSPLNSFSFSSLANICTPDLARDLAADIVAILNSSRAYLRKKGILVLYKIFLKFPEALRPSFPRLKDRLEDTDQCTLHLPLSTVSLRGALF